MPGEPKEQFESNVPDELNKELGSHKAPDELKVSEEEVLDLYKKQDDDALEEFRKRGRESLAKEILEDFFNSGSEDGHEFDRYLIKDKLHNISGELKLEVFNQWFSIEPDLCIDYLDLFGTLPNHLQKDIFDYCREKKWPVNSWGWSHAGEKILSVFDKIENEELGEAIIKSCNFGLVAENRSKLPMAREEQLLEKLHRKDEQHGEWIDYEAVMPYIDQFPSLDKNKAIQECFIERAPRDLGMPHKSAVIIKNKEKLGLSDRELLDIFYEHERYEDLVKNIESIDPQYHQELADKLISRKEYELLLTNGDHFKQIDIPEVLNKIAETKAKFLDREIEGAELIAKNLQNIKSWIGEIPQEVIDKMVEVRPASIANYAGNLGFGERVDVNKLVENLINKKEFAFLIYNADKLGIKLDADLANKIIEGGVPESLVNNINKFEKLPRDTYLRVVELYPTASHKVIFHCQGLLKEDAYNAIRNASYLSDNVANGVIEHIDIFEGFHLDQEFANLLLDDPSGKGVLISNFEKFKEVNSKEIIDKLINDGYGYDLIDALDKFKDIQTDREIGQKLFKSLLESGRWELEKMVKICEFYKPVLDKIFLTAYDIFGNYITGELYKTIQSIEDGSIGKEGLEELGIKKSGRDGINQLKERISKFKTEILEEDFDLTVIQESDFYKQYLKSYVRFEVSEWGEHGEDEFEDMINTFKNRKSDGRIKDLSDEYKPSGEVKISRVDEEAQESFQYSPDFLKRYRKLKNSLREVVIGWSELEKPLDALAHQIEAKQQAILEELRTKLSQIENPKAKINIGQKIERLENLNIRSIKDFESNFTALAQFDEFHDDLRKITFYRALKKHKDFQDTAYELTHIDYSAMEDIPSFENVGSMINFVNHIVNEETWQKYFKNKKAMKAFKEIVDVRILEEEFSKAQNQATKGTVPFEFIPTRGLLMEFSGHIADACWASKYGSIAEEFPNFSATIMVQNRGSKNERLAGATMMLETEAENGTPLLVIRGLNPIENAINTLQIEDFFDKFVEYAQEIAKKQGRKLAIVIDDHSGGSGTNRPALFNFLSKKRLSFEKIKLNPEDTTFNDYDITDDTYLLG